MQNNPKANGTDLKTICFVHPGKAQLPDIQAYRHYFAGRYHIVEKTSTDALEQYDILWFFMGWYRYKAKTEQFVVHEYSSLSLPPMAKLKDRIKCCSETTPNLRIFQNRQQLSWMKFGDQVPTIFRDMGVSQQFYANSSQPKRFDLVYVGAMDHSRQLHKALDKLLMLKPDLSVVMAGQAPEFLVQRYKNYPAVRFIGRIAYSDVPALLSQAHFGLNYVPDCYPYSLQSSTKLLEYLAAGLPVIGNMTAWCRQFLQQNPAAYFDIDQLTDWPSVSSEFYDGKAKLSEQFLWHNRIGQAGFEQYLPGELFKGNKEVDC